MCEAGVTLSQTTFLQDMVFVMLIQKKKNTRRYFSEVTESQRKRTCPKQDFGGKINSLYFNHVEVVHVQEAEFPH